CRPHRCRAARVFRGANGFAAPGDASRMKHFWRALRLALQYRFTVFMCMFSALMVGVLWGANIGTIYPFVEVAFKGQTLQHWVDNEINEAQELIGEFKTQVADYRQQLQAKPAQPAEV